MGVLKFNIDGSALGKSGPAGCGGVLRVTSCRALDFFLGPLGLLDSNEVELCAIWHPLNLFSSTRWASSNSLIIESDSLVAISWILHSKNHPWIFWHQFRLIYSICDELPCVCFHHVLREANSFANALAKGDVDRRSWFQLTK
ncbi:hypothetical protein GQ457_05G019080 [Hibiscus cannabinus]